MFTKHRPGWTHWQMKFNVAKCHSMRVTDIIQRKTNSSRLYTLHQQTLENVQSAKYFRITITDTWIGVNISLIFHPKQLGLRLGFLLRNLACACRSRKEVAVLLLWIFDVFFLSCVCYAFVRVCLFVNCGRLTSWLSFWCITVSLSLSHWYPGSGVVLDCIDS